MYYQQKPSNKTSVQFESQIRQMLSCLRKPRLGAQDKGQQMQTTSTAIHSSLEVHAAKPNFWAKAKEKSPKTIT